jgi:hypothetical protein
MTMIDRRAMFGVMVGGAAAAAIGLTLMPGPAESAPLAMPSARAAETENPVEKAVVRVRRRRKCWWHRGRRVCRRW